MESLFAPMSWSDVDDAVRGIPVRGPGRFGSHLGRDVRASLSCSRPRRCHGLFRVEARVDALHEWLSAQGPANELLLLEVHFQLEVATW